MSKLSTAAKLDAFVQLYEAGFMCDCQGRDLEEYADAEGQENVREVIAHEQDCRATKSFFRFLREGRNEQV